MRRDGREGGPNVQAESEELRSTDLQTPQVASLSRSAPDPSSPETEKGRTEGKGWRSLSPLRFARPLIDRLRRSVGARVALTIAGGAAAILGLVFGPLNAIDPQRSNDAAVQHVGGAALAASIAATEAIGDG